MNPHQQKHLIESLKQAIEAVEAVPVETICTQCDHLDKKTHYCAVHNGTVPEDFVVHGCKDWNLEIPF